MDKRFGLYIVLGSILGAAFGIFFGPVVGDPALAMLSGALGGVFIGWFIAAAVIENSKGKDKPGDQ
jgi:ABC-type uncharacterized transport system permease subunit